MIFIGEASLRRAVAEFMVHYHTERNHQGLDNGSSEPNSRQSRRIAPLSGEPGSAEC
jgi:hypothetical protein